MYLGLFLELFVNFGQGRNGQDQLPVPIFLLVGVSAHFGLDLAHPLG